MNTISVLIAAFDARRWLGDCLDAVYAQTLPAGRRLQVLLGVDGCADTLDFIEKECIEKARRPGLSVVYLRRNRGTYVTFNTLMRYADGDLIARFDADDVMRDGYLAAHIDALQNGADLSMSWSIYTDEHLRPTSVVPALPDYRPENGERRMGADGQFVAKRAVWDRLGGFRPWPCTADSEFVIRAQAAGFRTVVLEQFLYLRRTHAGSLTTRPATNYRSDTRARMRELTLAYRDEYRAGLRPVDVVPEFEPDHVRLTPVNHPGFAEGP